MDVGYLMFALNYYRNKASDDVPFGYREALDWITQYVDDHWDFFDDLLDIEREAANG